MTQYLSLFLHRGPQTFVSGGEDQYALATPIFAGGEAFGELLLLIFPFSIYKVFRSRLAVYLPLCLLLLAGIVMTLARSAILLAALQMVLFGLMLVARRVTRTRSIAVLGVALVAILVFSPMFASAIDSSVSRLDVSLSAWESGSGLQTALNRSLVWPNAIEVIKDHISLFGHGPVQAYILGIGKYNFHSLYLTLLFQFGIVGTAVWLFFFVYLGTRLVSSLRRVRLRTDSAVLLVTACLLSLVCFLLNEIKFEFNRADSFQQYVWVVFAVFYVCSATLLERKTNQDEATPPENLHGLE